MPLTGQGGQFGGPRHAWGDVRGAGGRNNADSGLNRGRFTNSPEAGLHRGEWQWRGHGPDAQRSYGRDYQGGRGEMGPSFQARMAQERGGGLPRRDYAVDYHRGERTSGGGRDVSYDWGWQGHTGGRDRYGGDFHGGMQGGGMDRGYGGDFRGGGYGASGGVGFGSGGRRGGYGQDFSGYGARGYDRGMGGGSARGGYAQRLSDEEFYRRVERW